MTENRVSMHGQRGNSDVGSFAPGGWLKRFQEAGGAWVAIGQRLHLFRPVGDRSTALIVAELRTQPDALTALRNAVCGEMGA